MSDKLKVDIEDLNKDNGVQVFKFSGDFDKAGYNDVRDDLNDAVKAFGGKALVFDFSGVQFINSEGIGYLLEVNNFLGKKDKKLVVVGVSAYVGDIFQTIGIQDIVAVYNKLSDFLKK